ncbi:putative type IX secretion system sortase PorU2 [Arachidicoccus ginsenosidimutans]|uniref:putative type IX secretion system sortase PorU2 n=1 Tax=Arachidicoccus sp. BS20 TaxID=1850526 RepID=UPI0018D443C3|nr:C25 family cysteine peptidase [Arachidicoccus sp. BS20]
MSLLFFTTLSLRAQQYNNEWIVYGQSYYKFKLLSDGLYRITGASLSAAGLGSVSGSQLQLWHNGRQVALYVSNSGTFGSSDYIEFWGMHNDGSTDSALFKRPADQINKAKSLETDSAAYFLTLNTNTSQNLRYTDNGVLSIPPDVRPEAYFMYTVQNNLSGNFNQGPAKDYSGDYVYLSDYQYKTFGALLTPGTTVASAFTNLHPYTSGSVTSSLSVGIAGSSSTGTNRLVSVSGSTGGTLINGASLGAFEGKILTADDFRITGNFTATVSETNSNSSGDRATVSFVSLTYPRTFDFGGQSSFAFSLPASAQQRVLQITDFNANGSTPVLYDLTNNRRYTANVSGGTYSFVIPATAAADFALAGQAAASYTGITGTEIRRRDFADPAGSANQGNYLIIYNKVLQNGAQAYQQYRASSAGGSFNARLYEIEDLEDEFAFGIHGHPLSIKNFLRYARSRFAQSPEYVLLLGRGLTFNNTYGTNGANADYRSQALLPTYGWPASDILLASDNFVPVAATPVGRVSAISSEEVNTYLDKVKAYEQEQQNNDNTIDNNFWKKNIAFISGGSSASEESQFGGYLNSYEKIMSDTLYGGRGYYFSNQSSSFTTTSSDFLNSLFASGMSLLSYYGHGASTTIGYAQLSDPSAFNNNGKYPVIFTSGCDVGNCFDYMGGRSNTVNNITERYLFTKDKGSVAFVAQTYLGITNILDLYNRTLYKHLAVTDYSRPVINSMIAGEQLMVDPSSLPGRDSISLYANAAQTCFLGDPAISLFGAAKPDFAVDAAHIIAPQSVSATAAGFHIKAYLYNLGKAAGDSVMLQVQRKLPSGTIQTLLSKNIPSVKNIDSVELDVTLNPATDAGSNSIIVTIDGNARYDELSTANNTATATVFVYSNGLTPAYPYDYSIIHNPTAHLIASTSDALAAATDYVMELDTTSLFNSTFKITKTVHSAGGAIDFDPGISYSDSTVYYWRVSPAPAQGGLYYWAGSSFQYIGSPNNRDGAGQSHLYQHLASATERIRLDSTSRLWTFTNIPNAFLINHAVTGGGNTTGASNFDIVINNTILNSSYYCTSVGNSIMFNIFSPDGVKPYFNQSEPSTVEQAGGVLAGSGKGFMGSTTACGSSPYSFDKNPANYPNTNKYNFQFPYKTTAQRNNIAQFMDWIPEGSYVIVRLFIVTPFTSVPTVDAWKTQDGTGSGSLYNAFIEQGLGLIDNFTAPKAAVFIYKKGDHSFTPLQQMTDDAFGQLHINQNINSSDTLGFITSPKFGPAQSWTSLQWNGQSQDAAGTDNAQLYVIGFDSSQTRSTVLKTLTMAQQNADISDIDAQQYPYLQLKLRDADSINFTPYQLRYWHLLYSPLPEGALAANILYNTKDTVNSGEDYSFAIAFKNISDQPFNDSLPANVNITSANNTVYTIPVRNLKKLMPGDTAIVSITIPGDSATFNKNQTNPTLKTSVSTQNIEGLNTLSLSINPNLKQPEETLENNTLKKTFFVASTGSATPITLLNAKAIVQGSRVLITWQTATETNNYQYIIERSNSGVNFSAIGAVAGAGNSTSLLNYSFVDSIPKTGINYYRIRQVDFDNRYTLSKILSATVGSSASKDILVYPNPVNNKINIQFPTLGVVNVSIYSTDGKSIVNVSGTIPQINEIINQRIGNITEGIYFIQLTDGISKYQTKFIKQ